MISSIIFTCDKNRDIYPFIRESYQRLLEFGDVLIVNETLKENELNDTNMILVGNGVPFKDKMLLSLRKIKSEFVLIMLDDYYVFSSLKECAPYYLSLLKTHNIDYLKICKDYYSSARTKKISKDLRMYSPPARYDINFHPSIWKKDVLLNCLENCGPEDIRFIESYFTKYMFANKKNSFTVRHNFLPYEELIVLGRFFRKPFKKYLKGKYVGSRKICSPLFETRYKIKKQLSLKCPQKFLAFVKKHIFKNKQFYSD